MFVKICGCWHDKSSILMNIHGVGWRNFNFREKQIAIQKWYVLYPRHIFFDYVNCRLFMIHINYSLLIGCQPWRIIHGFPKLSKIMTNVTAKILLYYMITNFDALNWNYLHLALLIIQKIYNLRKYLEK